MCVFARGGDRGTSLAALLLDLGCGGYARLFYHPGGARGSGAVFFSGPGGSSARASGRVGAGCRQEAGDASTGVALRAL